MNKYEVLFILNLAGKEEGLNEVVDRLQAELVAAGGKVDSVQKMDKKPFVRVTDRKVPAGHYVNIIFQATPKVASGLAATFRHSSEVYRSFFSLAGATAPVKV